MANSKSLEMACIRPTTAHSHSTANTQPTPKRTTRVEVLLPMQAIATKILFIIKAETPRQHGIPCRHGQQSPPSSGNKTDETQARGAHRSSTRRVTETIANSNPDRRAAEAQAAPLRKNSSPSMPWPSCPPPPLMVAKNTVQRRDDGGPRPISPGVKMLGRPPVGRPMRSSSIRQCICQSGRRRRKLIARCPRL